MIPGAHRQTHLEKHGIFSSTRKCQGIILTDSRNGRKSCGYAPWRCVAPRTAAGVTTTANANHVNEANRRLSLASNSPPSQPCAATAFFPRLHLVICVITIHLVDSHFRISIITDCFLAPFILHPLPIDGLMSLSVTSYPVPSERSE